MRIEHTCKNCGANQVVSVTVSTVNRQQTVYELYADIKQDDTLPIILNWLAQNEMIVAAGVLGSTVAISTAALSKIAGFSHEIVICATAISLPIGAFLPYFTKLLYNRAPNEDAFDVQSLERVSKTQAKLINRKVYLPIDRRGIPLFSEKDLIAFARMVVNNKNDISYAAGNKFGVKRSQFTRIRDWAITKGYLVWKDEKSHAQGVAVAGSGAYFRQLLSPGETNEK